MGIVILLSGEGTTLQAILDQCNIAKVVGVYSNNPNAYGLTRAVQANIPIVYTSTDLDDLLERVRIGCIYRSTKLIVLAGFMKKIPEDWIDIFDNLKIPIINIHPSLLPEFPGLNTYQQVLAANPRPKSHGFTIHYVDKGLDTGQIIFQCRFHINNDDTPETLEFRTKQLESRWYPIIIDGMVLKNENTFFGTKILNTT